jgi:hypothetical protein
MGRHSTRHRVALSLLDALRQLFGRAERPRRSTSRTDQPSPRSTTSALRSTSESAVQVRDSLLWQSGCSAPGTQPPTGEPHPAAEHYELDLELERAGDDVDAIERLLEQAKAELDTILRRPPPTSNSPAPS